MGPGQRAALSINTTKNTGKCFSNKEISHFLVSSSFRWALSGPDPVGILIRGASLGWGDAAVPSESSRPFLPPKLRCL